GLAYFRYFPTDTGVAARASGTLQQLVEAGHVRFEPLVYEDFLSVSAAGIFQSNLGDNAQAHYAANSNRQDFEQALGRSTLDELALYADTQRSLDLQNGPLLRALLVDGPQGQQRLLMVIHHLVVDGVSLACAAG
ncbi:hypothetical protein F2S75_21465, partial [Pseudomonas syringae pv. actinidiae]|nr:hypothetical protein [Pseudomonas syringae pv. actinidiae]